MLELWLVLFLDVGERHVRVLDKRDVVLVSRDDGPSVLSLSLDDCPVVTLVTLEEELELELELGRPIALRQRSLRLIVGASRWCFLLVGSI